MVARKVSSKMGTSLKLTKITRKFYSKCPKNQDKINDRKICELCDERKGQRKKPAEIQWDKGETSLMIIDYSFNDIRVD